MSAKQSVGERIVNELSATARTLEDRHFAVFDTCDLAAAIDRAVQERDGDVLQQVRERVKNTGVGNPYEHDEVRSKAFFEGACDYQKAVLKSVDRLAAAIRSQGETKDA